MGNEHPLKALVAAQKAGQHKGIYSVCSANEYVIEACIRRAAENEYVLVEATANQVNQFGGYTGMTPPDFRDFVFGIADRVGFPRERLILGGDHLGPLTWASEVEESAMAKSRDLIAAFVAAGFTKIHIDTSMHLGSDDKNVKLDTAVVARRGAELARVAEDTYARQGGAMPPVYVVGSEVPIPGGAQEAEDGVAVTRPEDFRETVATFENAFKSHDLGEAWKRVIAVVVQPGVEFGDEDICEYDPAAAKNLIAALGDYPNLIFEGHSTDYQTKDELRDMVTDHIGILKVGPALTFALREGIFALANIENALYCACERSNFIEVLEEAMLANPSNWKKHYHGDDTALAFKRKYSFSDRARYYLPDEKVQAALEKLISNLRAKKIPLSLLSQYMPMAYTKVREGKLKNDPVELMMERVGNCADEYLYATR